MNHDPLCFYAGGPRLPHEECECDWIAKVRADEREQAAQRVQSIPIWGDQYEITVCRWATAIAAARGEQS